MRLSKSKLILLVLISGALILIMGTTLAVRFFVQRAEETLLPSSSEIGEEKNSREQEFILYNDHLVPVISDLGKNPYDAEDFVSEGDRIYYTGTRAPALSYGIDISEFQGEVDWTAVKNDGIDFAILRTGFRGYTKGGISEDSLFKQNAQAAQRAGVNIGAYFFSQATNAKEGKEEAQFVLSMIEDYDITYPVVFDWEPIYEEDSRTADVSGEDLTLAAIAFCEEIRKEGYTPMIYMGADIAYYEYDLDALKIYDIWFADYSSCPHFYYEPQMWQYSCTGQVDGIPSNVDLNICFSDYTS